MARISLHEIDRAFNEFGKKVVKRARGNLTRAGNVAGKGLWSSIRYKYEGGKISFFMADYGPFQDQGVTGIGARGRFRYRATNPRQVARSLSNFKFTVGPSGPDAERSFRNWIADRNIAFRDERGRILPRRTATYILMRSVGRFGIKPNRFFSEAWERYYPEFEPILDGLITKAVDEAVNEIFDNNLPNCKTA